MRQKIKRLKELVHTNLYKKIDSTEWYDFYPIDDEKVIMWNAEIMKILESIDIKFVNIFLIYKKMYQ